jgi:hypothetical protein
MLFVNEIICTHVLLYYYAINIDYYMAFFISYPLSALGHDISLGADRLKG